MLTVLLILSFGVLAFAFVLIAPVIVRLLQRCKPEEITPDWLENFSHASYYPMQNLLSNDDFRFLAGQPGFDLSLYRKLRRERLTIFRQYLGRLIGDFNRLHTIARLIVARSQHDRSDLVGRLFKLKLQFSVAVIEADVSYLLCLLGFRLLYVRATIARLEEMNSELKHLAALPVAAR